MNKPMETTVEPKPLHGIRTFFTIWSGQLVSLLGSQLTGFALGVWVYEQTRSVSMLAFTQVALQAPFVLLSPLAGVFADRWNRRTAMIISDFGAGFAVLTVGLLFITQHLQAWMVILINLWMAAFQTLMWPSFTAATTLLVPKEHYGRASAFTQLGEALPAIAGPALAGLLYASIHLGKMALIDFATYAFSVLLMLFFVRIPSPAATVEAARGKSTLWTDMRLGWDYIIARKGLLALLIFFMTTNFLTGVIGPLITPLILDNWDASTLGFLSTLMGVGMLAGTLVMSAWGGTRRKIFTLLAANFLGGLLLMAVGLRVSLVLFAICGFGIMFTSPFMNASSQAIWQAKVAPDLQGRVFAIRRAIAWSASIVSPLLAAPLTDFLFKPAMSVGGALAPVLGPIFGVGSSRGVGVVFSLVGVLSLAATLIAMNFKQLRRLELDLPDHDIAVKVASEAQPEE
jgi:DHA3 family macrolide efflux protein-like MFS transporter